MGVVTYGGPYHSAGSRGSGLNGARTQGPANRLNQKPRRGRLREHLRIGPIPPQLLDGSVTGIEHDPDASSLQLEGCRENFLIPKADVKHGSGHGGGLRHAKSMGERERGAEYFRTRFLKRDAKVEGEDRIVFRNEDPGPLQWLVGSRIYSIRTDFAGKVTVYKRPSGLKSNATFASGKPF